MSKDEVISWGLGATIGIAFLGAGVMAIVQALKQQEARQAWAQDCIAQGGVPTAVAGTGLVCVVREGVRVIKPSLRQTVGRKVAAARRV